MTKSILTIVLAAVLVVGASVLLSSCANRDHQPGPYHCPMHPTYVSDRPGDCPICGMRLVPVDGERHATPSAVPTSEAAATAAYLCPMGCPNGHSPQPGRCPDCGMELRPAAEVRPAHEAPAPATRETARREPLFYRNPMDPTVTSPVPAKDSMGMDYVPVYADQASAPSEVPGMAPVALTPEAVRLAGVQTVPVLRSSLTKRIRTVGTVQPDETRVRHVHTKISGWVEKLFVNFTGQDVTTGQPLLSIYSPELLASQEEFLQARDAAARFAQSELPEVRRGGEDLVTAARRRLELFDVPTRFVEELVQSGQPQRTVTLLAPVSGLVTEKQAFEGQRIEPGMELFTITDLSRVWVEADFYEFEARQLGLGELATVSLPYEPDVHLTGRITFVNPTVDPGSRTIRARVELANPGLRLKPGMFANVELATEDTPSLVVPDSAVLDTGERQIVFVALGSGRFVPRQVVVAERGGGQAAIASGLAAGEQVVIRANFLLDSESRLRAAIAGTTAKTTPAAAERTP